jgi:hypothetical protein
MAKTQAALKAAQEKAAANTAAATPATTGSTATATPGYEVHPYYVGTTVDDMATDPRDLPQAGTTFVDPAAARAALNNNGFPGNGGGSGGGGGGSGGGGGGSYRASSSGGSSAYKAAVLPSATSQADYINAMYDANEQKRKAALETAYDANVATLDRQAATIAPQYQQAVNAAAAQSAVAQAAFNERAAAAGMNTGAGSQAALAQNNAFVSNVSAIRQAESEALADVEAKRADLAAQYQKAIAEAVANNEAERAQALYAEAIRVDESLVATAANQATENYRAWQAKYK